MGIRIAFVLLLLSQIAPGRAQATYEIDPRYPVHDLDPFLIVYADSLKRLTPQILLQGEAGGGKSGNSLPKYLQAGMEYWGVVRVVARDSLPGWTLQMEDNRIGPPAWTKSNGKVDLYAFAGDRLWFHKKTGVEYPRAKRDTDAHWTLNGFRLDDMPVNRPLTLIFHVRGNSLGYPAYFNLSVRSPDQSFYHQIFQFNRSFNIFMFGVTLIFFLYHLFLYFYLRERVILWFTVWLLFCTLTQAMTVGLLIGSFAQYRFPVWMTISHGIYYVFWFFGRAFISSRQKYPILDRFILALALGTLLEVGLIVFYSLFFEAEVIYSGVGWHYQFMAVYTVFSLVLSLVISLKKDAFARFFGLGSLIGSLALVIGTLWTLSILYPPFGLDPFATGIFLQVLIYSFGIAYRRRTLAQQAAQQRLEVIRSQAEIRRVKDLDALKTRFFTNISHEFRTPLTLIHGPITEAGQAVESEVEGASGRASGRGGPAGEGEEKGVTLTKSAYDMVVRNTRRLQQLVDELLELSRLESGKVMVSLKPGRIMEWIRYQVFSFDSYAQMQDIQLTAEVPEDQGEVWYDEDKLQKILTNLLSNAIKYTPAGGQVHLRAAWVGSEVEIAVSDSGTGIPPEELSHVFDRFYRVEGGEEKGTGIGLSLCKELVQALEGRISVRSQPGEGTSFLVVLPVRKEAFSGGNIEIQAAGTAVQGGDAAITGPDAPGPDADKPLILVVEDHPDLRTFIANTLSSRYDVLLARDGEEGLRNARKHIPDLVLSDVMMPLKDGFELCRELKSDPVTSHIPVILLTARSAREDRLQGLTGRADVYLTKPFESAELGLHIRNLLQSRKVLWEKFKDAGTVVLDDVGWESMEDAFFKKVMEAIAAHLDDASYSVEDLARDVGFSRAQLHRKLKAVSDKTPNQLLNQVRLGKAHGMLQQRTGTVSEIAYAVGFSSVSYFTRRFKEKFGIPPSEVPPATES